MQFGKNETGTIIVPIGFLQTSVCVCVSLIIIIRIEIIMWCYQTYFLLHSAFMLLCCDIAWIICILVFSSMAGGAAAANAAVVVVATDIAAGEPISAVTTDGGLNELRIWWMVTLFMCNISFFTQNPLPDGTMTIDFWKDRMPSVPVFDFSRKTPVTVSIINCGCYNKNIFNFFYRRKSSLV